MTFIYVINGVVDHTSLAAPVVRQSDGTVVPDTDPAWFEVAGAAFGGDAYNAETNTVTAQGVPEPAPVLPIPSLVANALLTVDTGVLDGLSAAAALSFAFAMGTGVYWVFFTEEMPDLNYSCNVNTSTGHANVTDRQTTYFEITVLNGVVPVDPAELSVQVFRTI